MTRDVVEKKHEVALAKNDDKRLRMHVFANKAACAACCC